MANIVNVQEYGNQLVVLLDDGAQIMCVPTMGGLWLPVVGGSPDPDPNPEGVFKWPFPRSEWNMTSYPAHAGIDRPGGSGDDVKCIGDGVVEATYAYPDNTYGESGGSNEPIWRGNCVVINHGEIEGVEIWSLYAHMLNAPTLSVNDVVSGGDVVGKVGNTGYSTGTHLHLEVIFDGVRLSSSTPGQTAEGLGFRRTLDWMDANTDGSAW